MKKLGLFLVFLFVSAWSIQASTPTVPASNFSYNNLQCNAVNLNWTNGNGNARVIFARKTNAPDYTPQDGTSYQANASFGSSTPYGSANDVFVVYNASGTNYVTVTGLQPGQVYYFDIYEHDNDQGGNFQYLVNNPPTRLMVTTYTINLSFTAKIIDSCQASNKFEFTNTSTSTIPGLKYEFNYGPDGTSTNAIDTHHFKGNGGYKDVLIVPKTSLTGCPSFWKQSYKVFPKKVAYIDPTTYKDTQCLEDNYFEIAATGILMPFPIGVTYHWKFGDGSESFFAKMKKRYAVSGTFNVILELGTSSNNQLTNCKDTIIFPITVLPSPVGNISINDTFQCLKHNKFIFSNPDNSLTYFKWYFGDADSSNLQNAQHVYKQTGTYKVMHVAYANSGCKGRDTVDVQVLPDLNSDFTGLDSFYCQTDKPVVLKPAVNVGSFYYGYSVKNDSLIPNIPGKYLLYHVVKDAYCADTTFYPFNIYLTPKPKIGNDTAICNIFSYNISANTTGSSYLWNSGQTTQNITVYGSGRYSVEVSEGKCVGRDTVNVIFSTIPKIDIGGDTMLCKGGGIWLNAAYPQSTYLWSTGSTDSMIYAFNSGKYKVTVTNPCGVTSDSLYLFYQDEYCDLFMANAFSPGNDLVNEVFMPRGRNITVTLFQIYNRWGELVFETDKDGVGWDGKYKGEYVQEGLYLWKLNYTTPSGPYIKKSNAAGQILLLR